MLLTVDKLNAYFGAKRLLFDVSLNVAKKEIVALIGPNGAGKTTTLRSIFGIHDQKQGKVALNGQDISPNRCLDNLKLGIAYTPQGGQVFRALTVRENLIMGGYLVKESTEKKRRIEGIYKLFPILQKRKDQLAGTLSGGERQMMAIGMAMILTPEILLLDEPSIGLAPLVVPKLMKTIKTISQEYGTSVLIVEQNAPQVLTISDRVYVMKVGRVIDVGLPEKYSSREILREIFLSSVQ